MELPTYNIASYYKNVDIIHQTASQIQKDMNIELDISGNPATAYEELFTSVRAFIDYCLKDSPSTLFPFLYRVDISEVKVQKILSNQMESPIEKISHLVIERELKKVLLRRYFSGIG